MDTGSDLEAGLAKTITDGDRAAHRAGRPVERGKESVAGRADLLPAEMRELATHCRVMLLQHVAPGFVAQRCRAVRRTDDVRKKDRGEHPVRFRSRPDAGEERLDLVDDLALVADPREVVRSGKLEELCIRDTSRYVSALLDVRVEVAGAVEDERRNADRGQDITDVDLRVHAGEGKRGAGTGGEP